ncbi:Uncharacterised protein [Burkholderia pseudomallei]|nr:putative polyketide synthase [Burkholderia pseudomallei]KKC12494.1 putative type-I PKS [Burkholderia pseudomallei MSHR1328]KGD50422.1 tubF domain protein [Burkholderia pseudomallei]KGD58178.1 tubF domain protein [Burkholderia pseudomallei]KGD59674.1 tubF domain protein [Burkholderia pseudomallei]
MPGSRRSRIDSRMRISPITPAAAAVCPMVAFTVPSAQYALRSVKRRNALTSALASTASPNSVPVPWAST